MATGQQVCDRAYQKIGVADPTSAEDTAAFNALNDMIAGWGTRFIVPYYTRESFDLVVGTAEYTWGTGGSALTTARPMRINNAYLVSSDNYSYPLTIISANDYNRIGNKTQDGRPTALYYLNEYTLVKLIFNKETDVVYTVYVESVKNFTAFATIGAAIALPSEYIEALIYNLAVKLAEDNSVDLPASVNRTAANSLILISRLLAANRMPPRAIFEFGGGTEYDIDNDVWGA